MYGFRKFSKTPSSGIALILIVLVLLVAVKCLETNETKFTNFNIKKSVVNTESNNHTLHKVTDNNDSPYESKLLPYSNETTNWKWLNLGAIVGDGFYLKSQSNNRILSDTRNVLVHATWQKKTQLEDPINKNESIDIELISNRNSSDTFGPKYYTTDSNVIGIKSSINRLLTPDSLYESIKSTDMIILKSNNSVNCNESISHIKHVIKFLPNQSDSFTISSFNLNESIDNIPNNLLTDSNEFNAISKLNKLHKILNGHKMKRNENEIRRGTTTFLPPSPFAVLSTVKHNRNFATTALNKFQLPVTKQNHRSNKLKNLKKFTVSTSWVDNKGDWKKSNGIISLLGLFELSTRWGVRPQGHSELAAAQLAVQHINRNNILDGYQLELLTNDTMCDPGVGVDRFFHAVYTRLSTRMVMLLGSACSEVTESLAKVVPYWNIVQVSFGSTSPALSDRREFPLFYRTVQPDSSHNPARIAFIQKFGWDTVTTFSQNEEIHSLAVNDLVTELESSNISCAATITFAETDFKEQLKVLRQLDIRIIIGSFSEELAPRIFCEAHKLGMIGADYVWILHEIPQPVWWIQSTSECNHEVLEVAAERIFYVSSHNSIVGNSISYSGLTNEMFANELRSEFGITAIYSQYAPQTYDAVWAIALALRASQHGYELNEFDYTRLDMAMEFVEQFSRLNFLGVSGPVSFSGPDRVGLSIFYQVQNRVPQPVALYDPHEKILNFACPKCIPVNWYNNEVPIAKRILKLRVATIAPSAFYTITTIATLGILISIIFLAFNLHFRKLKTIKLSSPKLSNITAVGCVLVYLAVILLGLDYSTLQSTNNAFPIVCTVRVYLLSSGFSLAFGSMFVKTYRVHRIVTHTVRNVGGIRNKMLQDTQLIALVCGLLLVDALVVTTWVVTDPIERHLSNLTLEISPTDRSVVYQPQVEVCRSHYTQTWLCILYAYKGLLLVVGVYMAWETRHVKIPALNDSQYIGVSVYSVVITSAIVVVLANLITNHVTLAFITITALILTSTTSTLCLLFVPKLIAIWGRRGNVIDPITHSMGLKIECNTRRFAMDDRREIQYRVEVQNRVYKKEIAALDAEIQKLERLLNSTNSSSSSSNCSIQYQLKPDLPFITELSEIDNEIMQNCIPNPALPFLLLSVLPAIPRASWPSADQMQFPLRRTMAFSSQPHLDRITSMDGRIRTNQIQSGNVNHQMESGNGMLNKLKGMFTSHIINKKSTTVTTNMNCGSTTGSGGSLAAVLKSHLLQSFKYSNTLPASFSNDTESNDNIICSSDDIIRKKFSGPKRWKSNQLLDSNDTMTHRTMNNRHSFAVACELHTESNDSKDGSDEFLPKYKKRIKGSPRFPHKIVNTKNVNLMNVDENKN